MSKPNVEIAAFAGLDCADQKHVVTLQEANSDQRQCFTLDQAPEALQNWIQVLRDRFAGRRVAIAVEQKRGALIYALALMHVVFCTCIRSTCKPCLNSGKRFIPAGPRMIPSMPTCCWRS